MIIARPVPDFSHKFEPQLTHEKTEPQPFGFEERYKNKPNRATLVQQILDSDKVSIILQRQVLTVLSRLFFFL